MTLKDKAKKILELEAKLEIAIEALSKAKAAIICINAGRTYQAHKSHRDECKFCDAAASCSEALASKPKELE